MCRRARSILTVVSGFVTGIVFTACSAPQKTVTPSAQWYSNMHRLSAAHLALMPYTASSKEFSDPARRAEIEGHLRDLAEASAAITKDEKAPNTDPIIQFSALRLSLEAKQAQRAFQLNDDQWARYALARAGGYCISCHTRADRGAKDYPIAWTPQLGALDLPQKVEFLLANRRYSSALAAAKELAADPVLARDRPRVWIISIEKAMAMVVRVMNDYDQAEKLAQLTVDNRSAPFFMRTDAARWLVDIRAWKKEGKGRKTDRLARAIALTKAVQGNARAALVANLRASALLHEELENHQSPRYGEALLQAGQVEQSLGDVNQGFLDQYYFESCIRQTPHSDLAERCYDLLDRSVQASNPFMDMEPELEWYRLIELRKLSEVKHPEDPVWKHKSWDQDLNGRPKNRQDGSRQ